MAAVSCGHRLDVSHATNDTLQLAAVTDRMHKGNNKRATMQDQQAENGAMGMASMMREVQELAEKFKVEEDEQYISPYSHLEKATVLQEAR
jgi:hypothetical protein